MHWLWLPFELFSVFVVVLTAAAYTARRVSQRRAQPGSEEDRLGLIDAGLSFGAECLAVAAVLLALPVGKLAQRRSAVDGRAPVILVHGFGLNRGCTWLLRRRLLRDGWGPIGSVDSCATSFDIEATAQTLRQVVDATSEMFPEKPLTLIGHGAGGLVIRCFARRYPAPSVRRIVTLGTPHFGTDLARWPRSLRQLMPGSGLLNALNAGDRLPQQFDVIALHSSFDAVVLPATSAHYPQAFNIQVNDVGHYSLLFSRKVYRLIAENLEAPFGGQTTTS